MLELAPQWQAFHAIGLDELNARARLLHRRDSKYVLQHLQLQKFLAHVRDDFDILAIDGLRQFQYETLYLDSDDHHCFQDHNKGRRRRFKIRFRAYRDQNLFFFEIKLKGLRGKTEKYRMPITADEFAQEQLQASSRVFLQKTLEERYGIAWPHRIQPSLRVDYLRSSLVSRQDAVRVTIDQALVFAAGQTTIALPADRCIVEIKSAQGVCSLDRWLFAQGIRPSARCSKYGMGMALLKLPGRNSRFHPVLRRHFKGAKHRRMPEQALQLSTS